MLLCVNCVVKWYIRFYLVFLVSYLNYQLNMAVVRIDPDVFEFCNSVADEERAKILAQNYGLISSDALLLNAPQNIQHCLLGTRNCGGECYSTSYFDARRNSEYFIMRCRGCKRKRSVKNAIVQGEFRGPTNANDNRSFFSAPDRHGRSQTKLTFKESLSIMYFWAKNLSSSQSKDLIRSISSNEGFVDWRGYLRDVCLR